jgi:hypothetical protein
MAGVFRTASRCRSPLESQQQSFLTDFSSGRGIDRQTKYPYSEGPLTPRGDSLVGVVRTADKTPRIIGSACALVDSENLVAPCTTVRDIRKGSNLLKPLIMMDMTVHVVHRRYNSPLIRQARGFHLQRSCRGDFF